MPALSPSRRKTLKIGPLTESGAWLAAIGLALALVLPATPQPVAAAPPRLTQAQQNLNAGIYPRTCVRRVTDLNGRRSEAEVIAEVNRRCFLTGTVSSKAAQPVARASCPNLFPWQPQLAAVPQHGLCLRQSRAGSRPQ